jgi:2-polyprenyl-3-methyl-5-hydroxy-6-metoxy-1,4-benzoquinol methylase
MPNRPEPSANDALDQRPPTSHERMTGEPWDVSYQGGRAPWDIGRPQQAFARVAAAGGFSGAVLDAGCGSGEHALLAASLGLPVLGIDVAETALALARAKAKERGIKAEFATADALHLERLGRAFETVLDCGLFHTFDDDERPHYVASLASVMQRGGTLYVLCFSDRGTAYVPHPVPEDVLRDAFGSSAGWTVVSLEPDRIETRFHPDGAPAWFAQIQRN